MNILDKLFGSNSKSELEKYIEDKNPQTSEELEFWMAEYDNRKMIYNRYIANGDVESARQFQNFF